MKALFKTTLALFILLLLVSCKKNETAPADNYGSETDTTEMMIDSVGPDSDTTTVTNPGTTGATGESSTGSGTAGSVQKGSSAVQDSATNSNGK
jgi:hypothetical protein